MTTKTYTVLQATYTYLALASAVLFAGWILSATDSPEAGFFYDFEFFQVAGQISGWVIPLAGIAYYLTYRRYYYGK